MKFVDLLKPVKNHDKCLDETSSSHVSQETMQESDESPEKLLRKAGYKIKLVTKTAFGVQLDLAKKYEENEIKKVLKNFNIKIKDNSVFVVD